jgi:predicted ATPase
MINSIKLHNFKCYTNQEIKFSNLTVFCGNNSVGKSTAIQALALPFQAKFEKHCPLNGALVNLGSFRDIFSTFASIEKTNEKLNIEVGFSITGKNVVLSMGYDSFDEQERVGNNLKLNLNGFTSEELCKWYFQEHGFQFLEAERLGPRNNFSLNEDNQIVDWVGSRGEFAIEVINKIETITNRARRLLKKDPVRDLRVAPLEENFGIAHNIQVWMSEISPGFIIAPYVIENAGISHATFRTNATTDALKPINMGFGLSYALGVVTALMTTKPGGLVIIENPEAHLHPRGQSYLGRLIALTALAGVQVIIETHSDHLLNGIRVIARLKSEYQSNMFKVYFISTGTNQSNATEINIGSKGELSSWPSGFFDQQALDIKTLMKGVEITADGVQL